ncbi:vacuolar protein sorting-associated protein 37B-like [Pocillopora verrucosa]|uniref:vacuolar protein sorting-associated protein 37C-like n=1 Tax=Pocillopora damicornis TaxID=46731 RepID=UPI000F551ADA|nr:vacuolar protein sorting-associated protein 37C-like [Pocillopora damicornis]
MSGYGAPSVAMAPFLNERKAIEDLTSLLKHIDDKGELKDLLENESQLNELIADNEEVKRIQVQRETLMASNRSLAEYNLSQQPILEAKKNALFEAHRNKAVIQEMYEEYRKKLDALSSQYSPDTTLALLQTSAAQAEEEAEKIADKFLDGEINVEDFIQSFQSQKTIHSLRKIKSEKLTEVLRSRMSSQYSYRL